MKTKFNYKTLCAIITLLTVCSAMKATTWRVNNTAAYNQSTNNQVYSTLTAAIGSPSVLPGDTLYIESSGTTYGVISLNKKLTLIGTGYYLSNNTGLQNNQTSAIIGSLTFAAGSSGSTIMGLNVSGMVGSAVILSNVNLDSITITRCYIDGEIVFQNGSGIVHNKITISKNFVINTTTHPVGTPGTITNLIVTNNRFGGGIYFQGTNHHGIVANNALGSSVNIQANIAFFNNIITAGTVTQSTNSSTNMYNNLFSITQPAWLTGGNNNFGVPSGTIYPSVGTPDNLFDPNPIGVCPQCYQGLPGGTTEVGMFGGNDPYILSGIPNIPTIYQLQSSPNAPQGGTLPSSISTRSNN